MLHARWLRVTILTISYGNFIDAEINEYGLLIFLKKKKSILDSIESHANV